MHWKDVQRLVIEKTGHASFFPEDRPYVILPLDWYLKEPWLGFKAYPYITAKCDCDDRCTIIKFEWLKRHLRTKSKEALPVFMVKAVVRMHSEDVMHWFMAVVTEGGIHYVERLSDRIVEIDAVRVKSIRLVQF